MSLSSPDVSTVTTAVRAPQDSSHGPEGEALVVEVRSLLDTLGRLLAHEPRFAKHVVSSIRTAVADAEARLAREELRIVVVGEPGSGKSTLLDALLGERVLGTTKIEVPVTLRARSELDFRARIAGGALDHFSKRVPDRGGSLRAELAEVEAEILQANGDQPAVLRELSAAGGALEVAEDALAEISGELETIREEAARSDLVRSKRDSEHAELRSEAERAELALPGFVRRRPAWWAIWHWLLWTLVVPFVWLRLRRRRHLLRALDESEKELSSARESNEAAAERQHELELARAEAEAPAGHARERLQAARERAAEQEQRTNELGKRRRRVQNELSRLDGERRARFFADLKAFEGATARRLVELEIDYPARVLPQGMAMLDVPGAFADDAAAEQRFWGLFEERADACIVVSELDRAVSNKTRAVLQRLRGSVVHAILVLTKLDQAVRTALRQGSRELSDTVEQARRIATRRFAREVGRDPDTVLSVAVAARDALEHAEEAYEGFEREAGKLFQLLRQERALILGSRCALVVRRCIAAAAETEQHAEQSYLDGIGALEARRLPEPTELRVELVRGAESRLGVIAKSVVTAAEQGIDEGVLRIRAECETLIFACANRAELRSVGPRLRDAILTGFERARETLNGIASRHGDDALRDVEKSAYDLARQRYDLLPEITRAPGSALKVELFLEPPKVVDEPDRVVAAAFRSVDRLRYALLGGGAAVGLVVGTIVAPGVGSIVGALIGSLATFAVTLRTLKKRCSAAVDQLVRISRHSLASGVRASEPTIHACLSLFLDELIDRALSRFGRWIAEPLEAERQAIQAERDKLVDLQGLVVRLEEHDRALEALSQAAAKASLGLCQ
jgi:adenylate kinase family enzyme